MFVIEWIETHKNRNDIQSWRMFSCLHTCVFWIHFQWINRWLLGTNHGSFQVTFWGANDPNRRSSAHVRIIWSPNIVPQTDILPGYPFVFFPFRLITKLLARVGRFIAWIFRYKPPTQGCAWYHLGGEQFLTDLFYTCFIWLLFYLNMFIIFSYEALGVELRGD